ncbi:MAG: PAS domain S-box protein [Acidobacteriota bacterium]
MTENLRSRTLLWTRKAPGIASAVAVLLGATVLTGWALKLPVIAEFLSAQGARCSALCAWLNSLNILTSFFPGQTSMRPNSAVAYILAGLALWLLRENGYRKSARVWRRVGQACALLVVAVGALTLSEYVFGINLGIDQLLFHDLEVPVVGLFPGRMTPTGALSLVFLGCGFLMLGWKKRPGFQPAEFLGLAVVLDGMFGLFDFILHPGFTLTGIAPGSSLVLCVLGGGLLTARADHLFRKLLESEHSGGAVFRRLFPAAVVIPIVLAALVGRAEAVGIFAGYVGLTLLVVMTMTAFVLVVMWTTGSLDEADQARQAAIAELDIRARQQAAVADLGHRALRGIDLPELFDKVVALVARTLNVEYSKVQELLPDCKALILRAGVGWKEGLVGHLTVEASSESQAGYTLVSEHPVIVRDLREEKRFIPSPLLVDHGVVSGLSVLIPGKDRPFGVLGAHTRRARSFTNDDVNFLESAANVLAAAIERKRVEKDLQRFNRALRTLSECNLVMVRATTEQELLHNVCNIMVDHGGYRMAWAGYAERDEARTVRPVAVAGADEGYLASVRISWADEEFGRGPTGTAIRTGIPYVVRDILNDEHFVPWREDAAKHGYASTAALPLIVDGQPLGVLRVYAEAPDAFDPEEMELLTELAGDLAYGVQALRTRIERAQAAEALRQSEEKFREMAENIREVLWMVDPTRTKVLYVSPSYESVWGRPAEAVFGQGHGWLDAVHPEDRSRVRTALGGDLPQREFETEFRVVWPDSSVHWVRDRSFPVRNQNGEMERIVGISEDITERRLTSEALLESEERYRQLFNQMNVGCALLEVICDKEGTPRDARFVDVNPSFESITGYPKESVTEERVLAVFPQIHAYWVERLGQVALTGESIHFEGYSDVFKKYFDVTAFRPRPRHFAIVFADITERKEAEQRLEEAERKYHSIFENAMEGIFQVREDGSLLTANPAMARILGYGTTRQFMEEVRNLEQRLYIEPRHPSGFIPLLRQQGAISEFEAQMRRKDGTLIWVMGSAYGVRDDNGKVLYYEGTLRDVTEHKKAEEVLRRLSSQLLHAQDDERRRIARELHDSTGQYLSALSMNLSWMAQPTLALDAQVRAVVRESIDLVKRALSEIRNFSYLLHPPVLDEYGLCAALRWYVHGFSQRSGINVELDVPLDLPRLPRQVETALFRVVQECLTNVHRHSGSTRAKILLYQKAGSLLLEVSDKGHGISAGGDGHQAADGERIGVGIAGIRERVRELGGRLEIDSGARGTVVRVSLPLEVKEVA